MSTSDDDNDNNMPKYILRTWFWPGLVTPRRLCSVVVVFGVVVWPAGAAAETTLLYSSSFRTWMLVPAARGDYYDSNVIRMYIYVCNVCRTVSLSWPAKSSELIRRREQLSSFGILKCAQVYYYVGRPVPDPTTNTTGPRRIAEKQNPVTQLWREFWTNQRINYLFWADLDRCVYGAG